MPKNGNRGANTRKSNVSLASNNEDIDSNVVFGHAKTTRKAKQSSTAEDSATKVGDIVPASSEDPPKQPDTRKLVSNIESRQIITNMIPKISFGSGFSHLNFPLAQVSS